MRLEYRTWQVFVIVPMILLRVWYLLIDRTIHDGQCCVWIDYGQRMGVQ